MTPIFWYFLLGFIIFIQLIVFMVVKTLGGPTFWEYIKSKMPWSNVKGGWFLKVNRDNRITFIWKAIPKNKQIKIKSGKSKDQDIYADLNKVRMYRDEDGAPVYMLTEDLPFTIFVKKYALETQLQKSSNIRNLIQEIRKSKDEEQKRQFVMAINDFLKDLREEFTYLPEGLSIIEGINILLKKDKDIQWDKILEGFNNLEDVINSRNYSFVNINDIFKSSEFVEQNNKNLINAFLTGYYEGQRDNAKVMDIVILILVIVSMMLSGYTIYKVGKVQESIDKITPMIQSSSKALDLLPKDINGHIVVVPSNDVKITNVGNTNITGGR